MTDRPSTSGADPGRDGRSEGSTTEPARAAPEPGPAGSRRSTPASSVRGRRDVGPLRPKPSDVAVLVTLIRLIALVALIIGVLEIVAGASVGEPRAVVLGVASAAFGLWSASRVADLRGAGSEAAITRIAVVALGLIAAAAILQPSPPSSPR